MKPGRDDVATTANPLVSVFVPSYNHAPYIEVCLDSLLEDGYPNLELVLIDDGSRDDSFEIAQRWVAQHGHRLVGGVQIRKQKNAGLTVTLNRLVAAARGDYVTMLASDDYLLPGGIAARVRYLQANPQFLAVCADAAAIDENGEWLAPSVLDRRGVSRAALRCDRTRALELIIHWRMPGPVYLARREVTAAIGPYDERFTLEDRNYYLRLLAAHALGYVDQVVAAYRITRVRDPHRYRPMLAGRELTEREMVQHFAGLERFALAGMLLRYPVPQDPARKALKWRLAHPVLKLLRRYNTWRAHHANSSRRA
jgi:glycosyltransferase involved in cell wall biosynthesis